MLTEPIEAPTQSSAEIPVLQDAIDPMPWRLHSCPARSRRRAGSCRSRSILRLRQRLDQELEAALADNLRLGAVAVDPAFTRVAQELRAILPVVVRESVEQVLGPASFEALMSVTGHPGDSGS